MTDQSDALIESFEELADKLDIVTGELFHEMGRIAIDNPARRDEWLRRLTTTTETLFTIAEVTFNLVDSHEAEPTTGGTLPDPDGAKPNNDPTTPEEVILSPLEQAILDFALQGPFTMLELHRTVPAARDLPPDEYRSFRSNFRSTLDKLTDHLAGQNTHAGWATAGIKRGLRYQLVTADSSEELADAVAAAKAEPADTTTTPRRMVTVTRINRAALTQLEKFNKAVELTTGLIEHIGEIEATQLQPGLKLNDLAKAFAEHLGIEISLGRDIARDMVNQKLLFPVDRREGSQHYSATPQPIKAAKRKAAEPGEKASVREAARAQELREQHGSSVLEHLASQRTQKGVTKDGIAMALEIGLTPEEINLVCNRLRTEGLATYKQKGSDGKAWVVTKLGRETTAEAKRASR